MDEIIDERTILIKYEDLLVSPEEIMKKIANHVGINYNEGLVTPTLLGKNWPGASSFAPTNGIDRSVMDRKLQCLSQTDIEMIGLHLKPILDHFNYKVPGFS